MDLSKVKDILSKDSELSLARHKDKTGAFFRMKELLKALGPTPESPKFNIFCLSCLNTSADKVFLDKERFSDKAELAILFTSVAGLAAGAISLLEIFLRDGILDLGFIQLSALMLLVLFSAFVVTGVLNAKARLAHALLNSKDTIKSLLLNVIDDYDNYVKNFGNKNVDSSLFKMAAFAQQGNKVENEDIEAFYKLMTMVAKIHDINSDKTKSDKLMQEIVPQEKAEETLNRDDLQI